MEIFRLNIHHLDSSECLVEDGLILENNIFKVNNFFNIFFFGQSFLNNEITIKLI